MVERYVLVESYLLKKTGGHPSIGEFVLNENKQREVDKKL